MPEVVVVGDGEAQGMAEMVRGLIGANLEDSPMRARLTSMVHGSVVLEASDRGLSVTLSFMGNVIEVRPFAMSGVSCLRGPWLEMTKVCSGRESPLRAIANRDLKAILLRPHLVLFVAAFAMKVPRSTYRDGSVKQSICRMLSKFWKKIVSLYPIRHRKE